MPQLSPPPCCWDSTSPSVLELVRWILQDVQRSMWGISAINRERFSFSFEEMVIEHFLLSQLSWGDPWLRFFIEVFQMLSLCPLGTKSSILKVNFALTLGKFCPSFIFLKWYLHVPCPLVCFLLWVAAHLPVWGRYIAEALRPHVANANWSLHLMEIHK